MKLSRQIFIYGLVGLTNGAVTAGAITLLTLLNINPIAANLAGYALGLANSFILNQKFTFRSRGSLVHFLVSFALAYLLNLGALLVTQPLEYISPLLPQMIGVGTYVVAFFLLMKIWVYRGA